LVSLSREEESDDEPYEGGSERRMEIYVR